MVKTYWSKKWGRDKICNITFSRLRPGKSKFGLPYCVTLNCNHSFYTNALIEWVNTSCTDISTCPTCRAEFDIYKVIMLELKS